MAEGEELCSFAGSVAKCSFDARGRLVVHVVVEAADERVAWPLKDASGLRMAWRVSSPSGEARRAYAVGAGRVGADVVEARERVEGRRRGKR